MQGLLLDTQVVIRFVQGNLDIPARERIFTQQRILVSHTTFWEIAIKSALGKLSMQLPGLEEKLMRQGFELLPMTITHIMHVHALPHHHRDPFDRMLIAQAQAERLTLMTGDRAFAQYDVAIMGV